MIRAEAGQGAQSKRVACYLGRMHRTIRSVSDRQCLQTLFGEVLRYLLHFTRDQDYLSRHARLVINERE